MTDGVIQVTESVKSGFWRKTIPTESTQRKAGLATIIQEKVDFRAINLTRYKDVHFVMITGRLINRL